MGKDYLGADQRKTTNKDEKEVYHGSLRRVYPRIFFSVLVYIKFIYRYYQSLQTFIR